MRNHMKGIVHAILANFICLALFPHQTKAEGLQINGSLGSNGKIHLSWNSNLEDHAYTLQEKRSLNSPSWRDVSTLYGWPTLQSEWWLPDVRDSPIGFGLFRVVAEPIESVERGKLLSMEKIRAWNVTQIQDLFRSYGFPVDDVQWSVDFYKVVYETVDAFGLPTVASGGVFVPLIEQGSMPTLSYQHHTVLSKEFVPSQDNRYWNDNALIFSSSGYLTLMPDYLGLGESPGFHPYLHGESEATSCVDFLRASKAFAVELNLNVNDQLFLTGYSQGGHATMALHRELESQHTDEWRVTASAPMAGPYDTVEFWRYLLNAPRYPLRSITFYALAAWLRIYNLGDTLEELLAKPYNQTIIPHLSGESSLFTLESTAGLRNSIDALTPEFARGILEDPNHPFMLAAADNSVIDWAPQAAVLLIHCEGDDVVEFRNAEVARDAYIDNGACCVSILDPMPTQSLNHDRCFLPSHFAAKEWFDSLQE